jgi:hypothetical protein
MVAPCVCRVASAGGVEFTRGEIRHSDAFFSVAYQSPDVALLFERAIPESVGAGGSDHVGSAEVDIQDGWVPPGTV